MDQKTKQTIIEAIKFRHNDGGIGGKNWTNHHGLLRCDCDELVEFLEDLQ